MLEDLDRSISNWSESLARTLSRRAVLQKVAKGMFATIAGASLGTAVSFKTAFAVTCTCHWACGNTCSGTGTNGTQCPSGYSTCVPSSNCFICAGGGNLCPYSDGSWVSCSGLGNCGAGYRICRDCIKSCTTSGVCTILSSIICGNCCNPGDVEAEMKRLADMGISVVRPV